MSGERGRGRPMTTTVVEMLTADDVGATPEDVAVALNAGSREALAEAFQRWSTLVYTIALGSLGSHHDAEDVTQQVFVSAWRSRHTLRPSAGALPGWLVGITRHRVADVQVQRMRASRNVAAVAAAAPRENAHVVDEDLPARLMLAHELDRMGEPRASVLRLALIETARRRRWPQAGIRSADRGRHREEPCQARVAASSLVAGGGRPCLTLTPRCWRHRARRDGGSAGHRSRRRLRALRERARHAPPDHRTHPRGRFGRHPGDGAASAPPTCGHGSRGCARGSRRHSRSRSRPRAGRRSGRRVGAPRPGCAG